ncbi:hypothetical protein GKZ87_07300 [Erysipelotrichaceae bacterium 66202529]|nr:hypothetical protein GKZ87_07300 [Erysipelotrichaceae bacterium 66202529]DAQ27832.1 MAG TPA: hypothetical protein [Caudoviricetes sp.]
MVYHIYNTQNERIGILQNYSSIQWMPRYDETGTFEIHVLDTKENIQLLQIGNRLIRQDDGTIGFIEYTYSKDRELEIRGHMDNLNNRINRSTVQLKKVLEGLYDLVNKNKRKLPITTAGIVLPDTTIDQQTTWQEIRKTFSEICKKTGYGYRMVKDGDEFNVIQLYRCKENEDILFSEELNNVIAESYLQNMSDYKNFAYVAGEGEGNARTVVEVDQTDGGERFEVFVDAKDLQKVWLDESGTEHRLTDTEYDEQLRQRGINVLKEHPKIEEFQCEIDLTNESYIYKIDYQLGDIVKIKSQKYGFIKLFRLTGLDEVDEGGLKLTGMLTAYVKKG